MKFLSIEQLELLTSFLSGREIGDYVLNGRIEAFSCKRAGEDKKLSKMLEAQYADELSQSPSLLGSSPLGPLSESTTRRLLIDLISTMNASFPDHDFSSLRPEQFCKVFDVNQIITSVNKHLAPLTESYNSTFLDELWLNIDDVVKIQDCTVFSYLPDMEDDPFSQGNQLWSFNYFLFNRSLKRIVYFTCIATSKFDASSDHLGSGGGGGNDYDDEYDDNDGRHMHGGDNEDMAEDFMGDWECEA